MVAKINEEFNRLIGMSPKEAVKQAQARTHIKRRPGTPYIKHNLRDLKIADRVRYLLTDGEHDSSKSDKRYSADSYWSLELYEVIKIMDLIQPGCYHFGETVPYHKLREKLQLVESSDFGEGPSFLRQTVLSLKHQRRRLVLASFSSNI